MPEEPTIPPASRDRGWLTAACVACAIVILRSVVLVFWERAQFDSDQAVMGLMAKHLVEGRALPIFMYGQRYILGVEAWLAAPLFAIAGPSVTALKLPLLAINLAVTILLFRGFTREVGLRPFVALVPTLFFALPAPGTVARLLDAGGGNVEPFLYVVLIWMLRRRPIWCGAVLGIGFLQREFTMYGFLALLCVEAYRRDLFTSVHLWRQALTLATAASAWATVQVFTRFSSGAGPGTTMADVYGPSTNLGELAARSCFNPASAGDGGYRILTEHWPTLFGTASFRLADFGIVSANNQGSPWSAVLLVLLMGTAAVMITARGLASRGVPRGVDFCAFLMLTGAISVAGYVVGRCGAIDFYFMRYELLSVVGAAGLAAWFLRIERCPAVRRAWLTLAALCFAVIAVPHARLLHEYVRQPPEDVRRTLISHLDARGIRYAASHYWIAYAITFLTDERIVVKSEDFVRIREYERLVDAHRDETWRIAREACGEQIMPRVYLCR